MSEPIAFCMACGSGLSPGDLLCCSGPVSDDKCKAPGCDGTHVAEVAIEVAEPVLFKGHSADLDMDFLVTVYPDGSHELAMRPGVDQRWETWGRPVRLVAEPVAAPPEATPLTFQQDMATAIECGRAKRMQS